MTNKAKQKNNLIQPIALLSDLNKPLSINYSDIEKLENSANEEEKNHGKEKDFEKNGFYEPLGFSFSSDDPKFKSIVERFNLVGGIDGIMAFAPISKKPEIYCLSRGYKVNRGIILRDLTGPFSTIYDKQTTRTNQGEMGGTLWPTNRSLLYFLCLHELRPGVWASNRVHAFKDNAGEFHRIYIGSNDSHTNNQWHDWIFSITWWSW